VETGTLVLFKRNSGRVVRDAAESECQEEKPTLQMERRMLCLRPLSIVSRPLKFLTYVTFKKSIPRTEYTVGIYYSITIPSQLD
jgi:hypothetical protein